MSKDAGKTEECLSTDIWRNSPLRYMGYANEIGEAFRPLAPKFVRPSYAVAFGYVFGDTTSKVNAAHDDIKDQGKTGTDSRTLMRHKFFVGFDCLVWQTLASVMIPGAIINTLTKASVTAFASQKLFSSNYPRIVRFGPTAIGLIAIPFIIEPIDESVTALMDVTLRKYYCS
jgi:mitochondrial fission process protein 1